MRPASATRWRALVGEVSWVGVGEAAGAAGSVVAVRVLTGVLSPAEYGYLGLGLTVATLLSQTLFGPLAMAGERFFATAREKDSAVEMLAAEWQLIVWASSLGLVLGLLATLATWLVFGPSAGVLTAAGALFAIVSGWERIVDGLQNAMRARIVVAWHQALRQWLRPLLGFGAATSIVSAGAAVLGSFAIASLAVLTSQLVLARGLIGGAVRTPHRRDVVQAERHRLLSYALPFAGWGVFTWLQLSTDRWALETLSSPESVGVYTVLLQVGFYPLSLIGTLIAQLVGPILYQQVGDARDRDRVVGAVRGLAPAVILFGAASLVAVALSVLLSAPILGLVAARDYQSAAPLLPLAVAAAGLVSTGQLLALVPLAAGRSGDLLLPKVGCAIISVPMYVAGAAVASTTGVLVALVLVNLLYLAWSAQVSWSVVHRIGHS